MVLVVTQLSYYSTLFESTSYSPGNQRWCWKGMREWGHRPSWGGFGARSMQGVLLVLLINWLIVQNYTIELGAGSSWTVALKTLIAAKSEVFFSKSVYVGVNVISYRTRGSSRDTRSASRFITRRWQHCRADPPLLYHPLPVPSTAPHKLISTPIVRLTILTNFDNFISDLLRYV